MLDHLEKRGGALDYVNTNGIKKECDAPWDTTEHIVAYFNWVNNSVKQLDQANIASDKIELLRQAL